MLQIIETILETVIVKTVYPIANADLRKSSAVQV
jgi:hypothetical protein